MKYIQNLFHIGNNYMKDKFIKYNSILKHKMNQSCNFVHSSEEVLFYNNKHNHPNEMAGWEKDSIIYNINNYGFRSDVDFIKGDNCNVFLGCSYTFGEAVPTENTWPILVNNQLNDYTLYNLGVPGGGPESCYRVLKGFIDFVNIKRVFLLLPLSDRREFYYNKQWYHIKANSVNVTSTDIISGIFSREEAYINRLRNIDAIKFLCHSSNIPLYMLDLNDVETEKIVVNDRTARDLLHPGKSAHSKFAEIYLSMIK